LPASADDAAVKEGGSDPQPEGKFTRLELNIAAMREVMKSLSYE